MEVNNPLQLVVTLTPFLLTLAEVKAAEEAAAPLLEKGGEEFLAPSPVSLPRRGWGWGRGRAVVHSYGCVQA